MCYFYTVKTVRSTSPVEIPFACTLISSYISAALIPHFILSFLLTGEVPVPHADVRCIRGGQRPNAQADLLSWAPAGTERHRGLQEPPLLLRDQLGRHPHLRGPVHPWSQQPHWHLQLWRGGRLSKEFSMWRTCIPRWDQFSLKQECLLGIGPSDNIYIA